MAPDEVPWETMRIVPESVFPNLIIRKQSGESGLWGLLRDISMSGKTKAGTVVDYRRGKALDSQAECLILIWILI